MLFISEDIRLQMGENEAEDGRCWVQVFFDWYTWI